MNKEPERNIRVTLTRDEFIALRSTVSGELESLTQDDENSGVYDDLRAAQDALIRAWKANRGRKK